MKLDANGLVVLEQDKDLAGNVGDSCAETSRMVTLQYLLNIPVRSHCLLFVTDKGVVRYPGNPPPWPESDTSDDQICPLIAALHVAAKQVIKQIESKSWETGNGEIIHLTTYAQIKRNEGSWFQGLWDLALVIQSALLALPFAWNPKASWSPRSWFVSATGQSADYLNFVNALAYARLTRSWTLSCWLATKLCKQETALAAIASYYKPEPNVLWLLQLYAKALPKIWGRV